MAKRQPLKWALLRNDHWNDQLSPKLSGKRLPRADFVNWLVLKQSADLSETDIVALHSEHFDPVRALEWAVKKVKEAQAKGESVNIHQFVDQTILKRTSTIKRKPIKPISVGKKVNVPKANDQEANKE